MLGHGLHVVAEQDAIMFPRIFQHARIGSVQQASISERQNIHLWAHTPEARHDVQVEILICEKTWALDAGMWPHGRGGAGGASSSSLASRGGVSMMPFSRNSARTRGRT